MNKQSISFKADEQKLTKTGGIEHYASNIVAYIEATFDLGANWNGYDSVRAVWSNDYLTDISTVLDNNGKCIVPTEVLTDTGNVMVNLVGSIADGDTLTDRLTTYPCKAVIVDADAKVEGDETESITPSQFEQFVEIVHDEVEQVTGMTAEAETLPAGSDATASYSDGVLSLGIPQGIQGERGEQGETGETGAPAGFGDVTASVDNTVGTPSVNVHTSGPDTAKEFDFAFHNLKGDKGDTGDTGATGNGIASTVLNPDYTLTITFTDGTSYTTPSIRGAKGDTGNTGATGNGIQSTVLNADYTLTITFTDGTSYTTPSIRGEQGPVGPVSDVTVNGTSVVDQNGVAKILMPELIKTVNGNPIVLDDAFGEVKKLDVELLPIQDLHGYSKPWSGGNGKNKVNYLACVGVGSRDNSDSVDASVSISSDVVTLTGYASYNSGGQIFKGIGSPSITGAFTVSADVKCTANTVAFGVGAYEGGNTSDVNMNFDVTANTWTHISRTFTDKTYSKIGIFLQPKLGTDTLEVKNLQLEEGSTATSYAPYTNICPITGHDSVTVTDTGKNLFDATQMADAGTGAKFVTLNLTPNATYTMSSDDPCKNGGTITDLFFCNMDEAVSSGTNGVKQGKSVTRTADANGQLRVGYRCYEGWITPTQLMAYQTQVEVGSTASSYTPYKTPQIKTVPLPHTVYGAGVGVTSGTGKEKIVKIVLDGTQTIQQTNWRPTATSVGWIYPYSTFQNKTVPYDEIPSGLISDCLPAQKYNDLWTGDVVGVGVYNVNTYGLFVRVGDTSLITEQAINAYLAEHPITVCYELADALDLSTTPTDITLYNGDNVVSSDGDMELTYVQDMAIVIRKIESQL